MILTAAQAALITQLAALAEAVIELRQAQQRAAQAAAARRAAEQLRIEGRRLTRRTESPAARSVRLAAADFPVAPWNAPRAARVYAPEHATGPRSSRGPASARPRGPTR